MISPWDLPDFDAHESVCFFRDEAAGLTAIIAVHSTHLGPAAGGARFWQYADRTDAVTDALRLSRGMSFKNAMAGLPVGGGKGVILAQPGAPKTAQMLAAFGRAIDSLGGRYVTAEDVGMTDQDMLVISTATRHVCGLPAAEGAAGGDPGPSTAKGVYLGIKAGIARALGRDSARDVHVAIQGIGSVGSRVARLLAADGARLTLTDVDTARAEALAHELGAETASADDILRIEADVLSPCALGAILHEETIADVRAAVIAGAANNQLRTADDGDRLTARGILYAPDYVINAGGIINVVLEHFGQGSRAEVDSRIAQIPTRLEQVWAEAADTGAAASTVADRMAMRLIGRG